MNKEKECIDKDVLNCIKNICLYYKKDLKEIDKYFCCKI